MFIRDAIQQTLTDYDAQKGWHRALIDPAIIKSLRVLFNNFEKELNGDLNGNDFKFKRFNNPDQIFAMFFNLRQFNKELWKEFFTFFIEFKKIIDKTDMSQNKTISLQLISELAKNLFGDDSLEIIDNISQTYSMNANNIDKAIDLIDLLHKNKSLTPENFQKVLSCYLFESIHQLFSLIDIAGANIKNRNGEVRFSRYFGEFSLTNVTNLILGCSDQNIAELNWILGRFVSYHKIYDIPSILIGFAGYTHCEKVIEELRKLTPNQMPNISDIKKKINLEIAGKQALVIGQGFRDSNCLFNSLPFELIQKEIYPRVTDDLELDETEKQEVFKKFFKKTI